MNTKPQSNPSFQAMVIWAALLMSQGMIVLVSQTAMTKPMNAPNQPSASGLSSLDPKILMVVAGVIALMAYLIPQLLFAASKKKMAAIAALAGGAGGEPDMKEIFRHVFMAWIVRWAMLEAVTLMGFISAMITAQPTAIYPFAAVSFVGFILTIPTEQKLRASAA